LGETLQNLGNLRSRLGGDDRIRGLTDDFLKTIAKQSFGPLVPSEKATFGIKENMCEGHSLDMELQEF
jgi:hypothetical protein